MTGTAIVVGLVLVFFALLFTLPDRDRTRVNLYNKLQSLGVSARIEERGHQAEQISRSRKAERWELRGHSLGVIEITGGPIRWVNVKRYGADHRTSKPRRLQLTQYTLLPGPAPYLLTSK